MREWTSRGQKGLYHSGKTDISFVFINWELHVNENNSEQLLWRLWCINICLEGLTEFSCSDILLSTGLLSNVLQSSSQQASV